MDWILEFCFNQNTRDRLHQLYFAKPGPNTCQYFWKPVVRLDFTLDKIKKEKSL